MSLANGARLGPYEVTGRIGAGGMGEVYRARDSRLGRDVAIKVLPEELSSDPDRRSRFEQEARSASALNHPNIVTVHDIGISDSTVYIAMELVEGRTVRELLVEGPMATKKMLSIAAQTADGLARAHSAGIVHRDLKPENLMVTKDGFVKILDFGLAKLIAPIEDAGSELATMGAAPGTQPGVVLGTVGYMSPEQASGAAADFRSDQFAFGAILYEMATGKRAFSRGTAVETLSAIIRDDPEPMGRVNPAAPAPLRWIVESCLQKDPDERYASTRDLARDLKHAQERLSDLSQGTAAVAGRRRLRASALVPALLGLVALLIAADAFLRLRPPPRAALSSNLQRLTFGPGLEDEPTWSPDGKFLAYTTDERGNLDVVVQPLAGGETLRIAGNDADEAQPAWSPDGSKIAFVSSQDRGGRIHHVLAAGTLTAFLGGRGGDVFVVPALGGAAAKLVENGYFPAWSPDGKKIVFSSERAGKWDLWVVSSDGGTPKRLTDDSDIDYQAAWSPDGKWIAYGSGTAAHFDLKVVAAEEGAPHRVDSGTSWVLRPAWSADGRSLVYSGEREGLVSVWRLPVSGGKASGSAERVTVGPGADVAPTIDRGGRIAFATVGGAPDIWEWSLSSDTLRQVTSETGMESNARLAPDGKMLLFASDRGGSRAFWSLDFTNRTPTRITTGKEEGFGFARWSPDGRRILFQREGRMWIQPLGGLSAKDLGIPGQTASWSPDGSRIVFSQGPDFLRQEIYVMPAAGGEPKALTSWGRYSTWPSWSPDGSQIVYQLERDGARHLWVVSSSGGESRQLTTGDSEESHPEWSPVDPDRILFLRDHARLYTLSVSTGRETPIDLSRATGANFPSGSVVLDYPSWSRDGSRIYFDVTRKTGDIYLLAGD
ncbi:MAG TPA: protein kinase [Thermoanaerobaculia bacterium]|nr:protein kinase [Thermoanaerobaculia bacterium]